MTYTDKLNQIKMQKGHYYKNCKLIHFKRYYQIPKNIEHYQATRKETDDNSISNRKRA